MRTEKEMKVKPAISFKLLTIFIHKNIRHDSKQKNVLLSNFDFGSLSPSEIFTKNI